MPRTNLKSKNMDAKGTNKMDEPKPDIVPKISARRAKKKNK
jgi:hypothetical protein